MDLLSETQNVCTEIRMEATLLERTLKMQIRETSLAIHLSDRDAVELHREISLLLGPHDQWDLRENRPDIPLIGRIFDDLDQRGLNAQ